MIQTLSLLGSTGSIGTQALDIIRRLGIQVKALAAYRNIERLEPVSYTHLTLPTNSRV